MVPDIFRVLVQSEMSNLPVTCTQMIAATDFVSRGSSISMLYVLNAEMTQGSALFCFEVSAMTVRICGVQALL